VRDAVKKKLPDGVPKPGKFKLSDAAPASTPEPAAKPESGQPASAEPKKGA
jgi:hypothetical protein